MSTHEYSTTPALTRRGMLAALSASAVVALPATAVATARPAAVECDPHPEWLEELDQLELELNAAWAIFWRLKAAWESGDDMPPEPMVEHCRERYDDSREAPKTVPVTTAQRAITATHVCRVSLSMDDAPEAEVRRAIDQAIAADPEYAALEKVAAEWRARCKVAARPKREAQEVAQALGRRVSDLKERIATTEAQTVEGLKVQAMLLRREWA